MNKNKIIQLLFILSISGDAYAWSLSSFFKSKPKSNSNITTSQHSSAVNYRDDRSTITSKKDLSSDSDTSLNYSSPSEPDSSSDSDTSLNSSSLSKPDSSSDSDTS
ncbi:hypothetical protein, partial [Holospora curviuscula]|uniref:hypothetical protein n=1 Tax=Holospora curviuscula TaxID=1082868 RepID=UPI00101AD056